MSAEFNNLRLEQLQEVLKAYKVLLAKRAPPRGWLKEIREALGRTDRKSTRLNSSHLRLSRMPSSA